MEQKNLLYMNTAALAFMGDAVYETYVRKHLLDRGQVHGDKLHRSAVNYVRADAQAKALKEMLESLSEDELALVKRARNRRTTTKPKNADPIDYKWATAFEALIGYLFLSENKTRMEEVINGAILCLGDSHGKKTGKK